MAEMFTSPESFGYFRRDILIIELQMYCIDIYVKSTQGLAVPHTTSYQRMLHILSM